MISAITAFVLPPIYKSSSTILIEGQQIPSDLIRSTVTSFIDETIQILTQRVMSRRKLMGIINQLDLYPDLRTKKTREEIIEKMRESIKLETINAQVVDKRSGRPTTVTIAFKLSYEGKNPDKVQQVTNLLTSFYLEENLKTREQKAKNTSRFLESELERLNENITQLEIKIANFKGHYFNVLPEMSRVNLEMNRRLERDLEAAELQIKNLQERMIYLQGQLATIDPYAGTIPDAKQRLAVLQAECLTMEASFLDEHPDLIKIKKEIKALEKEVGLNENLEMKQRQLQELKAAITKKKAVFSNKHPDVIKLKKELASLSEDIARIIKKGPATPKPAEHAGNPAYINISIQIATAQMEMESLKKERINLKQKISTYQKRLELTPQIEMEYKLLTRDYENARIRYREILDKVMEAKAAEALEKDQKAEKFTIIDPANYPEKPNKPNRLAIVLIGFILALGAGVGFASVKEYTDDSIRTEDVLTSIVDLPVLSTVSLMETAADKRKKHIKIFLTIIAVLAGLGLCALFIHIFIMRLDIMWFKALRYWTPYFIS